MLYFIKFKEDKVINKFIGTLATLSLLFGVMLPLQAQDSVINEDVEHVDQLIVEEVEEKEGEDFEDERILETLDDSHVDEELEVEGAEVEPFVQERTDEEVVLVPNDRLRIAINASLNADYIRTHNPTLEELQGLKTLKILDPLNSQNYVSIDDFTGFEHLISLEELDVAKAFVSSDFFGLVGRLPKLKSFDFINSYTIGNVLEVGLNNATVNDQIGRFPFDPNMYLGDLGVSKTIESIYVSTSYVEVLPNYQYYARGILNVKGLERLTTLKSLEFGVFADVDDKNMEFLKGLTNLERFKVFEIPFENVDAVNTLENATDIHVNWMNVTDYSGVNNPAIQNTSFDHRTLVVGPEGYEKTSTGYKSHYKTGIKIPDTASNVTVTMTNGADLVDYEIIDGILYLNVITDEFEETYLYNPLTNARDLYYKGFAFSLSYTLQSGIVVNYPTVLADVSDLVVFNVDVIDENGVQTQSSIRIKVDEFTVDKVPTKEDFNLSDYEMTEWYTDEALTQKADFTQPITQATTFFAKAQKFKNTYTVTFESNGGSTIEAYEDVKEDETISEPTAPVRQGYSFVGWYADTALTTAWDFSVDRVNDDITLYAKWKQDNPIDPVDPVDPVKPVDPKPKEEIKNDKTPPTGLSDYSFVYGSIILGLSLVLTVLRKKNITSRF